MARYDYSCPECGLTREEIHSMKETPAFYCEDCKTKGKEVQLLKVFSPTMFFIRGGTEATHWKEKRIRMDRRSDLGVKQIERYGSGPRARPNVAGVETETWSDAAKMAKEAGLNPTSYEPIIEKESRTSKTSGIDDAVWKQAKEKQDI